MPKLLIIIQGGVVAMMYSDSPIEVKVIDMDSEEVGEEGFEDTSYNLDSTDSQGYEKGLSEIEAEIQEKRKDTGKEAS